MARALLITNPAAARTDPDVIRAVCAVLGERGIEVDVAGTTKPGDAGAFAERAANEGVEVIAIYGGDGTTMQAVRGIVGCDMPLALIPGGTGNILAGNLRIPRNPRKAAELVLTGRPRRIDLGKVQRGDGVHYFAVNCGAGFDAELMATTSGPAKRRWGMGAYLARAWQKLGSVASIPHRIQVDGQVLEMGATTVLVANCGELVPPFLRLNHGIAPDDGVLDVIVLSATGMAESMGVLWKLASGWNDGADGVRHARGRCVTVEALEPRLVQLDGEPAGMTPFTAEVLPHAITVLVPAE